MKSHLANLVPDVELYYKAEIAVEIRELKKQRNAVVLGHNYMEPVLFYSVPDFKGDSLDLSRRAAQTDKDVIVFCGVRFMAETAKILNPVRRSCCRQRSRLLAGSITARTCSPQRQFRRARRDLYQHLRRRETERYLLYLEQCGCRGGLSQVGYRHLSAGPVLAANVAKEVTNTSSFKPVSSGLSRSRQFDDVQMIGWHGKCEVHEKFTVKDIQTVRRQFPDTVILSHPECSPEVVAASDFSGGTNAMIKYVQQTQAPHYLMLTECSMGDNVAAANPDKEMLRLCMVRCPHMNMITMEDTRDSLKYNQYVIEIPEEISVRAFQAVDRMIRIG
jgi:quinolinate synthase